MTEQTERRKSTLSQEQLETLAELLAEKYTQKAAEATAQKAVEMMKAEFYQEAGKTFIKAMLYILGIVGTGILYFLNKTGVIHIE